jgi:hypothetical protein
MMILWRKGVSILAMRPSKYSLLPDNVSSERGEGLIEDVEVVGICF